MFRNSQFSLSLLAPLLTTLLWGCSPAVPPEEVATTFWAATLTGDRSTVERVVAPGSFVVAQFDAAKHNDMYDSVVVGPVTIEDDRARIDTRLRGVFYGEPGNVEFDTVAVIHEGDWKIDYRATASEMIGAILEDSVTAADAAIRSESKTLEESMNESVREDLKNPPGLSN